MNLSQQIKFFQIRTEHISGMIAAVIFYLINALRPNIESLSPFLALNSYCRMKYEPFQAILLEYQVDRDICFLVSHAPLSSLYLSFA